MIKRLFIAACISQLCHAQSLEETKAYILRELPEIQRPWDRGKVWFTTDGAGNLVFVVQKDEIYRVLYIKDINVASGEDAYGGTLMASGRAGTDTVGSYKKGADGTLVMDMRLPAVYLAGAVQDFNKLGKMEKAFNHLIELVTGRKELF